MSPNHDDDKNKKITIIAASAEGDTAQMKVNFHDHISQVLHEALEKLYGHPTPEDADYDVIFNGVVLDIGLTVEQAGIVDNSEVAVLPKDVSRG